MKNKKLTGSFYTPKIISDFLVDYLCGKLGEKSNISILEPSAGDGSFINSLYSHSNFADKIKKVVAVEKNKRELNKITKGIRAKSFNGIHSDFLDFQNDNSKRYDLVIGNPPYIKKNLLKENQVLKCKKIHQNALLSDTVPKNIWTAFLVRCIEFTNEDGILAFVLPSELLQVKFAAELRELILRKFERVEIFTFNELLFKDCKGQDTLLLIGEKKSTQKGIYYSNIANVGELERRTFNLSQNVNIKESKWTHQHLSNDEIELLEKIRIELKTIDDYCSSKAGIVTAANNYFIVDSKIVQEYSLQNYIKPIVQKGFFVNGSVVFGQDEFNELINSSKPTYLIALDENSRFRANQKINQYLKLGVEQKIHKRYKTSIRNKWYEVPNIGTAPEAFFFKRCNEYPKLIKNDANVLATDSAYVVHMKEDYKIEDLIYSFYNSLTLAFAELRGRFYGGGVLELTPNEFKNIPVPFTQSLDFNSYVKDFKGKTSIKSICEANDRRVLKSADSKLDDDSIKKLAIIREKLFLRRIKAI